ncbi:NADPH:quinone reductase [Micromonospora inyonensis]|uniref:NADPH2:quinone reductase n=1 Tax=Micromonospora inyonensis TaxID=47866 RepID=A0A1C6RIT5_9ACTN|nr:NADPH:quinone reductase [Micromonospora inyonensis]SCL17074.1 NADPH2:quinone reductase [Micromonospora inyonensis]
MKAIVYERNGDPSVLQVVDRPVPEPGPGEVLVRLAVAGVNPTDWKGRRNWAVPDGGQTPGQDGAGVIEAVGNGLDRHLIGERVWVWEASWQRRWGTAAEYTVVPARQAVPLGDASFDLGACLGIPFLTAHRCLTAGETTPQRLHAGALTDRVVLVQGGAGAVGNAAVQLARWADATVIATVSGPEKALLAAAAGADHVINYREQDVAEEVRRISPDGVDVVVEVSAARNAAADVRILRTGAVVSVYADDGGDEVTLPVRALMLPNARWQFVLVYTTPWPAKEQAIADVTAAVAQGHVGVGQEAGLPLHHYPLDATAAAHRVVEDSVVGKVLISTSAA